MNLRQVGSTTSERRTAVRRSATADERPCNSSAAQSNPIVPTKKKEALCLFFLDIWDLGFFEYYERYDYCNLKYRKLDDWHFTLNRLSKKTAHICSRYIRLSRRFFSCAATIRTDFFSCTSFCLLVAHLINIGFIRPTAEYKNTKAGHWSFWLVTHNKFMSF